MTTASATGATAPRLTVAGEPRDSADRLDVVDPATAETVVDVPVAGPALLDEAVAAAAAASTGWAGLAAEARGEVLLRLVEVVRAHLDELAVLLTREQGKPLGRSRSEIESGLRWVTWAAENPLVPEVREQPGEQVVVRRVPVGVVAAVTAWNYPLMLALMKLGPALATGNVAIVKPSPYTPLATLRLGELVQEVLPPGVAQVLAGGDELGRALVAHPGVGKVSFTGSVATGRAIMAAAAPTLKRLTLELGGNDAGIVLDDADPAELAPALHAAALSNAGQVCVGLKRLFVPAARVGEYLEALAGVAAGVVVGNGLAEGVDMGPVQNRPQLDRVRGLLAASLGRGAELAFTGQAPDGPGNWHPVTLVEAGDDDVPVVAEEQFGPVLPVLGYDTVAEAVGRANGTPLGLGASVWTPDPERAAAVADQLVAGSVWHNGHPVLSPDTPFGGLRQSGIGVESGRHGLAAYTDVVVRRIRR